MISSGDVCPKTAKKSRSNAMIGVIGTVQVTEDKELIKLEDTQKSGKCVMNHRVLALNCSGYKDDFEGLKSATLDVSISS